MGFTKKEIIKEEWEVVKLIASQVQKNPHWMANFNSNMAKNQRIIKWDLRRVGLTSIPEEFGRLTKLEWVDLMGNSIKILPSSIGNLRNLQQLEINPDVIFPPEMGNLTKLYWISFGEGRGGGMNVITPRINVEPVLKKLNEGYYVYFTRRTPVEYFLPEDLTLYLSNPPQSKQW